MTARSPSCRVRWYNFPAPSVRLSPIYNVEGLTEDLRLSPEALAGIFLGRIHRWNDPAIKTINRGAMLPDHEIRVVHRTDGSGTTFVWTDYLSKVSPQWKSTVGVGTTVKWPVGVEATGNEGTAQRVRETPYSIGYVEFILRALPEAELRRDQEFQRTVHLGRRGRA